MTPAFFRRAERSPQRVQLACYTVLVRVKCNLRLEASFDPTKVGLKPLAITVRKGQLTHMQERLVHEALHLCGYVGGARYLVSDGRRLGKEKLEECIIRPIAPLLCQFLEQCR